MAQTVLLFELEKDKECGVKKICDKLRIRAVAVRPEDCAQQIGHLAGIKGFRRQGKPYTGAPFPAEMLVFSGMDSGQVDEFLDEYKKTGMKPVGLKAIVTEHNVFWTPQELFRELLREHKAFH